MQQTLKLLRRTSKSLSIEDLAKLLNPGEEGEVSPPAEGDTVPPSDAVMPLNPNSESVTSEGNIENSTGTAGEEALLAKEGVVESPTEPAEESSELPTQRETIPSETQEKSEHHEAL